MSNHDLRPGITLGHAEHHQLSVLAMLGSGHSAEASDALHYELGRARLVPDDRLPPDTVRMGSGVTYRLDNGGQRAVTLVYPEEAEVPGTVSILTPVGTALIGLRPGQEFTWMEPDGRTRKLTVGSVTQPAART